MLGHKTAFTPKHPKEKFYGSDNPRLGFQTAFTLKHPKERSKGNANDS